VLHGDVWDVATHDPIVTPRCHNMVGPRTQPASGRSGQGRDDASPISNHGVLPWFDIRRALARLVSDSASTRSTRVALRPASMTEVGTSNGQDRAHLWSHGVAFLSATLRSSQRRIKAGVGLTWGNASCVDHSGCTRYIRLWMITRCVSNEGGLANPRSG